MRDVLLVGAGAVGQVYGAALARGGDRVSFLVKPAHEAEVRAGLRLIHVRRRGREEETLRPDAVLTSPGAAAERPWAEVWLCVPTDALGGSWASELLPPAAAAGATIVSLQPGTEVKDALLRHVPATRLVLGLIGMIAWQAPLPNERSPEGVAFLFPPGVRSRFGGEDAARVRAVIAGLRAGRCPAGAVKDPVRVIGMGSAVLMPNIVALEAAGWSIRALRGSRFLRLAAAGAREAQRVVARRLGVSPPLFHHLLRAPLLWVAWAVAPHLLPLDVETYLRYHFTKVRAQTELLLRGYVEKGPALGVETPALAELARTVFGA